MAAEFLETHGIDLQDEMSSVQFPSTNTSKITPDLPSDDQNANRISQKKIHKIVNVKLPCRDPETTWDISLNNNIIYSIDPHDPQGQDTTGALQILHGNKAFLMPSFCHPHVHLDKCFLLYDPKYSDLYNER